MLFQPDGVILLFAFLLDLLLKDPASLPHPIRWMGKAIEFLEPRFRRAIASPVLSGALFSLTLVLSTWTIGALTIRICHQVHPVLAWGIEIVLLWYCISAGSLAESAGNVVRQLLQRGVSAARREVSMIVGRDTESLGENGILRAALETTAENFVDGVFAPMFYYALGGIPLALAYKMVNTLDSMVGYRNDRYIQFGKPAARIDDVANWIPARLAVLLVAFGAHLLNRRGRDALHTALREGRNHLSPNSGYPEAAFAGALHVRLNGPNFYYGILVEKPYIGKDFEEVTPRRVFQAIDLMLCASFLGVCILAVILR